MPTLYPTSAEVICVCGAHMTVRIDKPSAWKICRGLPGAYCNRRIDIHLSATGEVTATATESVAVVTKLKVVPIGTNYQAPKKFGRR